MIFGKGTQEDIDALAALYDGLNDYLEENTNYPGWKKGIYPTRDVAVKGIEENTLHVARLNGTIVGTVILNHEPEAAYDEVKWKSETDYQWILVLRTFVVDPKYMKIGVGKAIMEYCDAFGLQEGAKSIRLDVYENNMPAIKLYERCGYEFVGTVDLGFGEYGLDWFKLYEKLLL